MPRDIPSELFSDTEEATKKAKRDLQSFAPPRKQRGKKESLTPGEWAKAKLRAAQFMEHADWTEAWPRDFVAAYAMLHKEIYGVDPVELTPEMQYRAAACMGNLLGKEFHDDKNLFAEFMRWTWTREEGREKWRRANNKPGGRITWQAQFLVGSALSDWRLDHVRRGKR